MVARGDAGRTADRRLGRGRGVPLPCRGPRRAGTARRRARDRGVRRAQRSGGGRLRALVAAAGGGDRRDRGRRVGDGCDCVRRGTKADRGARDALRARQGSDGARQVPPGIRRPHRGARRARAGASDLRAHGREHAAEGDRRRAGGAGRGADSRRPLDSLGSAQRATPPLPAAAGFAGAVARAVAVGPAVGARMTGPDTGTFAAATTRDRQSPAAGDVRWRSVVDPFVRKLSRPVNDFTSQRPFTRLGGTESPSKFCPAAMNGRPLIETAPSLNDWPSPTMKSRLAVPPLYGTSLIVSSQFSGTPPARQFESLPFQRTTLRSSPLFPLS